MSGTLDEEEQKLDVQLSVNGREYTVPHSFLAFSGFVQQIRRNDPHIEVIPITLPSTIGNVEASMQAIMTYFHYHEEHGPAAPIPKPLRSEYLESSGVSEWDIAFIDKTDQELTDLSNLSNYMDIPSLLSLCCAKVGSIMKSIMNKYPTTEEQMEMVRRRWHGIPDDTNDK